MIVALVRNKMFVYATGAVLIIGIALFSLITGYDKSRPGPVADQAGVVLTDEGFNPASIIISKGGVVVFSTTRKLHFWPASNLHPTHDIYSEFDPKEPLTPEESWSFQFDKTGEWKYHDHLAPYFTGTITVVEAEKKTTQTNSGCSREQEYPPCWEEKIITALNKRGIDGAFNKLKEIYDASTPGAEACHSLSHNLGLAAYKLYLENKKVFVPEITYCASGFLHGFMEAFLSASADPLKARSVCEYIRGSIDSSSPDAGLQCYHGIGHGAMDLSVSQILKQGRYSNEESLVGPALTICKEASKTEEEIYRCASGAFNGLANYYIQEKYGIRSDEKNPLRICEVQPEEYKESCYGNMNSILFVPSRDKTILSSTKYIEEIEEDKYAIPAIRYLAGLSALYITTEDPEKSIADCRTLQDRLRLPCIEGLAHGLLEHGTPSEEYKDAFGFCRNESLRTEERDACLVYLASNLQGWYSREKVNSICPTIPDQYQKYCKEPANG